MISVTTNSRNLRTKLIEILCQIFLGYEEQLKQLLLPENMYQDIVIEDVTFDYHTHFGQRDPQILAITMKRKNNDGKWLHSSVDCKGSKYDQIDPQDVINEFNALKG